MSSIPFVRPKTVNGGVAAKSLMNPLNLHWAGVGLLVLLNLFLLVRLGLLWHGHKDYNSDAQAEQRIELKTVQVAAAPLRGLDGKLATATTEADRFYAQRLPASYSEVAAELGVLTRRAGVRLVRVQYQPSTVLAGSSAELNEVRMDATLNGDYRPLVIFMNSLERDKMFFVINAVTLTGQQTGMVSLRLRLTTYLRGGADLLPLVDATKASAVVPVSGTAAAGGR